MAQQALKAGEIIVMPTDTVYGVACDAFLADAVTLLLASKGRGRHMPPPVLVGSPADAEALAVNISEGARAVMEAFWPGGVTIIVKANPSVAWDLGETAGTVALRMPDNDIALELLNASGPLAVSSANKTGQQSAHSVEEAVAQLGDSVSVYLDGGVVGGLDTKGSANPGSTIIDATALNDGGPWRVVRHGVVPVDSLVAVAKGEWEL
jgi:tRNA threonylcarbamoyl adenosine modification protein (Sua5/YciO/YrdC/YwlC family)